MNQELTSLFKGIIQQKGLVRTGRLLNSIKVVTQLIGTTLTINIMGVDYLGPINTKYKLTDIFISSDMFQIEAENLLYPLYEIILSNAIDDLNTTFSDPQVIVRINGI